MANAAALRLVKPLRELRIHLCQTSAASAGARSFIENQYVGLKKANPEFPILIRECSGIEPKAFARFDFGRESSVPLKDLSEKEVLSRIEGLTKKL